MKVVFVNPPFVYSENSSRENNFKIDGFIFKPGYRKLPGAWQLFRFFNKVFGLGKGMRYGVRAGSRWPSTMDKPLSYAPFPFFMSYAAANLKKQGIEVNILDAVVNEEYSYPDFIEKVRSENASIVVLECSAPTINIDLWVAEQISSFAKVALAGPHLASQAEEIKKKCPYITYFLKGEYILSSYEMIKRQQPGIYEGTIVEDLDSLPFPFRDFLGGANYYDPSMPTERPQLQMYASKGCPFECTFCLWPQTMYERKVSLRKPRMISREIQEAVDLHGYKSIFFDDDTFNLGTERVKEICSELKKIGLPWTMIGRLDCSPDWLYDKMIDSGCVGMRFGIETFNLGILEKVKKGIERKDFIQTLSYISQKYPKLMIHLTMMKDLPEQTEEIHRSDIKILQELGFSRQGKNIYRNYQLSRCAPFPGTKIHEELIKKVGQEALKDYRLYDGGKDTIMKRL